MSIKFERIVRAILRRHLSTEAFDPKAFCEVVIEDCEKSGRPLSQKHADWLAKMAKENMYMFDATRQLGAIYIREEIPLPSPLREIIADIVDGSLKRPQKGSATKNIHRHTVMGVTVWYMALRHNLNITRNDATAPKTSACDLVARLAQERLGYPVTYDSVRKYYEMVKRDIIPSIFYEERKRICEQFDGLNLDEKGKFFT